jgi:hypothetical protein
MNLPFNNVGSLFFLELAVVGTTVVGVGGVLKSQFKRGAER